MWAGVVNHSAKLHDKGKAKKEAFCIWRWFRGRCNEKMDQMLSSLDLLEMNIGIRMNHALKDASEKICNKIEITEMHIEHMENKLVHHEEKELGKTFQNVVVSA